LPIGINGHSREIVRRPDEIDAKADEIVAQSDEIDARPGQIVARSDEMVGKSDENDGRSSEIDARRSGIVGRSNEIVACADEIRSRLGGEGVGCATKASRLPPLPQSQRRDAFSLPLKGGVGVVSAATNHASDNVDSAVAHRGFRRSHKVNGAMPSALPLKGRTSESPHV
jgi:hypothetical protein